MKNINLMNKAVGIGLAIVVFATPASAGVGSVRPNVKLFPSDVTEHLSKTGAVAGAMEENLKGTIQTLESQHTLYKETGCDTSSIDPGCAEIANQIADQYMEMLTIMENNLPEIKQSVDATNKGIEKNLRSELGKKASPADIQRLLTKGDKPKIIKSRYSLSARFAQYHDLVSSGRTNTLATLAAEIFLDSREVLNMIEVMEAEIAQQKTLHKLGQMYGTLTPEMTSTVNAVKTVLFGEEDDSTFLPEAKGIEASEFQSPLERG